MRVVCCLVEFMKSCNDRLRLSSGPVTAGLQKDAAARVEPGLQVHPLTKERQLLALHHFLPTRTTGESSQATQTLCMERSHSHLHCEYIPFINRL